MTNQQLLTAGSGFFFLFYVFCFFEKSSGLRSSDGWVEIDMKLGRISQLWRKNKNAKVQFGDKNIGVSLFSLSSWLLSWPWFALRVFNSPTCQQEFPCHLKPRRTFHLYFFSSLHFFNSSSLCCCCCCSCRLSLAARLEFRFQNRWECFRNSNWTRFQWSIECRLILDFFFSCGKNDDGRNWFQHHKTIHSRRFAAFVIGGLAEREQGEIKLSKSRTGHDYFLAAIRCNFSSKWENWLD